MLDRRVSPRASFRHSELDERVQVDIGLRPLLEGARQVSDCRVGGSLSESARRSSAQSVDDEWVSGGRDVEEVRRDELGAGARPVQDRGCLPVQEGALDRSHPVEDGGADDGVRELQWRLACDETRPAERVCREVEPLEIETCERGRATDVGLIAEDCRRPSELHGIAGEPCESKADEPTHPLGGKIVEAFGVLGSRSDLLSCDRIEKRSEEERIASRHLVESRGERLVRLEAVELAGEGGDRRTAERPGTKHVGLGIGQKLGEQRRLSCFPPGTGRRHEQKRKTLDPPREIHEPVKRRRVEPMRVVECEEERSLVRQIGGEPVEAVEHDEGGVGEAEATVPRRGTLEEPPRESRGAAEQLLAQLGCGAGEHGLEHLADGSECELALELAAARMENAEPFGHGDFPRFREQTGLSDPDATFEDDQAAVAGRCCRDCVVEKRELALALQKRSRDASPGFTHEAIVGEVGGTVYLPRTSPLSTSRVASGVAPGANTPASGRQWQGHERTHPTASLAAASYLGRSRNRRWVGARMRPRDDVTAPRRS